MTPPPVEWEAVARLALADVRAWREADAAGDCAGEALRREEARRALGMLRRARLCELGRHAEARS